MKKDFARINCKSMKMQLKGYFLDFNTGLIILYKLWISTANWFEWLICLEWQRKCIR